MPLQCDPLHVVRRHENDDTGLRKVLGVVDEFHRPPAFIAAVFKPAFEAGKAHPVPKLEENARRTVIDPGCQSEVKRILLIVRLPEQKEPFFAFDLAGQIIPFGPVDCLHPLRVHKRILVGVGKQNILDLRAMMNRRPKITVVRLDELETDRASFIRPVFGGLPVIRAGECDMDLPCFVRPEKRRLIRIQRQFFPTRAVEVFDHDFFRIAMRHEFLSRGKGSSLDDL